MDEVAQRIRDWLGSYGADNASVASLLCDRHPADDVAVTEVTADLEIRDLTYGELRERSERRASGLAQLGVGPGDQVGTHMEKGHDLVVSAMAIWRLGAVLVPLFTGLAAGAIDQRLADSGARIVIVDDEHARKLRGGAASGTTWRTVTTAEADSAAGTSPGAGAAARTGGQAPFLLVYTSGPTGRPRGVAVPVRALAAFHSYYHYSLDVAADDVFWNATDPGWSYGLYFGVVAPLLAGHRTVLLRAGFDAELTLDVLSTLGVTNFTAAPAVYRALRAAIKTLPPEILPRRLSSAGEPLRPDVAEWAFDMFGVAIREHYGQTELGICAGYPNHPAAAAEHRPGSAGTALPGWTLTVLDPIDDIEVKAGEPGRLAVDTGLAASPLMWFSGYHTGSANAAASVDRFSPDGRWYLTGDAGCRDDDGHLYFSSRDHDAIVTAGYRVSPIAVETALVDHPAVAEAAVFGISDEIDGEIVAADVVLNPDCPPSEKLAAELQAFVRDRFATHAYPRRITFVAQLPRTASGKMQRGRIRHS